jgi:hypothetical protein
MSPSVVLQRGFAQNAHGAVCELGAGSGDPVRDFSWPLQDVEITRCKIVQLRISCESTEQITADEGLHRVAVASDVHASVGIRRLISQPDFGQQARNRVESWCFLFAYAAILRVIDAVQLEN